jgi:ubiquinone/menaquinone biosynthesis C-methylase UbiE
VDASGLDNVVLVHGDAHRLPLADKSIQRINCSGGLHAFPDLPKAIGELARVAAPGATLTASTFAESPDDRWALSKRQLNSWFSLHFVPIAEFGELLEQYGFRDYTWSMNGGGFAYTSAVKD